MSSKPPITALMVTKGDKELVSQSYKFFANQDYPNKKLLIVTDCNDDQHSLLKPLAKDKRVTIIHVGSQKSLGELRNLAIKYAPSRLSIQWDDDDWYAPTRMTHQFNALGNKQACMLTEQLHYFRDTNEVAWTVDWTGIEGTILLDRLCKFRYPTLKRGEDTVLKEQLDKAKKIVLTPGGICYCRTYHGANTWDRKHHFNRIKTLGKTEAELRWDWDELKKAAEIYKWPKGWKTIGGN